MPNIPRAQRTKSIPGVSGNVQVNVGAAGQAGAGLSKVADTVSGIVQEHAVRIKKQTDFNTKVDKLTDFTEASRAYLDEQKQARRGKAAGTFYEDSQKWVKNYLASSTADIKDPSLKKEIEYVLANKAESYLDSASRYQAAQMKAYDDDVRNNRLNSLIKQAGDGDFSGSVQEFNDVIMGQLLNGSISDEESEGYIVAGERSIATAHILGLLNTNPSAIDEIKELDMYKGILSSGEIAAYAEKAERLIEAEQKDIKNQAKERDRLAKVALKEAQKETGDQFLQDLLDGKLTQADVLKSNLNPTGENSKKTWIKEIEAKAKKSSKAGDDKWKTDPVVEADLQTKITLDPDSVSDIEIMNMQGKGLSTDDAKSLVAYKKKRTEKVDDPQKTQEAKTAYSQLRFAKTSKLYDQNDPLKNQQGWAESVNMLSRFIDNHPDENPSDYVEQLLEPVKATFMESLFDYRDTGTWTTDKMKQAEKDQQLNLDAGPIVRKNSYGKRPDGTTKGPGFLGEVKNSDGSVSTERSIGVNIAGEEVLIPLIVADTTPEDLKQMEALDNPDDIPKPLVDKAVDSAKKRISMGKSPFASAGEKKKKVTVKIIKKSDGTHEAVYPNGVRRAITIGEDGKVVF